MVPVKGLDVLLQAWEQVTVRGSALYLVGKGPLEASLRKRANSVSLKGRVRFVGSVAHDALPDWYRAAELTVLSSHSEGTPNVLLESLACGTPFLASRVGGIHELTDDPDRDLVPPGDPQALAAALTNRLSAPPVEKAKVHPLEPGDPAATIVSIIEGLRRSASGAGAHA